MSQVQKSGDGAWGLVEGGGVFGGSETWPCPGPAVFLRGYGGLVDAGTGGAGLDRILGSDLILLKLPWLPAGFSLLGGM